MAKVLAKRLAAAALSAVMAFTAAAVTDGTAVRAASKEEAYVSLRTTYKTLKVGETNRMTLKNNTLGWKITKIATEDRTVAMVYQKSASGFMIKGKSAGKTKVKARLRADRKKYNSKLVKCTVNVVADSQTVPVAETAKSVATQAELDAALAAGSLTEITIDTKEKQKFVIQEGDHSNVALIVKAPQSDIENNAKFKSVDIQEIAGDTWQENASGNTLRISASSARIIVGPNGVIRDISFTGTDAKVKMVVNGTVENVTVSAKMSLDISSDLDQKPTVPVTIDAAAKGAEVTAQIPLDLTVRAADTVLNFQKGSEGSKVKAEAKATVNNSSSGIIYVTDAKSNTRQIQAGGRSVVNTDMSSNTSSSGGSYQGPSGSSGSSGSSVPSVTYYTVSFNGKEVRVQAGAKVKESDIPVMSKRNGDGFKFSGWYYADGKDDSGNTKYTKFDLINTAITRNLTLYPRWGMTEADRVLDIRGKLYITSGSAIKADLSRSNVTAAIGDDDERAAEFVKIGDTAITASAGEAEVSVKDGKDGKLEIMIQLKDRSRRFRTEIPLPAGAETEINLAECKWSMFNGESINVKNQEQLNVALANRSYSTISIDITTPGAVLMIGAENRQDVKLYVHAAGAKITNNAVFNEIYFETENITWTENAKGNQLHVLYGTSSVTVAKGAEAASVIFDWGGEGSLIAEGTVKNISLWNDRKPEDTKSVKITVSGTSAANIPCGIQRSGAAVTTSLPLDVTIFDTAPRTVVNFEAGSGNSTVTAYVEAEINNHSGQEIIFKKSGK